GARITRGGGPPLRNNAPATGTEFIRERYHLRRELYLSGDLPFAPSRHSQLDALEESTDARRKTRGARRQLRHRRQRDVPGLRGIREADEGPFLRHGQLL